MANVIVSLKEQNAADPRLVVSTDQRHRETERERERERETLF